MLGLFGTLNLAAQSLQVQGQGIEVAGHNLANVNNPAYARQRLNIQTAPTIPTPIGPQGTGSEVETIQQLRSRILDQQVQSENSVQGALESQQSALQMGESILGQAINRAASGPAGSAGADAAASQGGLAESLASLFNAFQNLSTDPSSITARQSVLLSAQNVTNQFNQVDAQLGSLNQSLNDTLQDDTTKVNDLLATIANYNKEIVAAENGAAGSANDLRDLRQQSLEQLAKLTNIQTAEQSTGAVNISIAGTTVISGATVQDTLQVYDAGGGQMLVSFKTADTQVTLTGGAMQGLITGRDGALKDLRDSLNTLATQAITQINTIHGAGYSLTGTTGQNFFNGTNAADISVNHALLDNPALLQVSSVSGEAGNNQVALALAQLADQSQAGLNHMTFSQSYAHTVASLGQAISSVNSALNDQQTVSKMLLSQRDSVSGVSLDEEMTDLTKYQRAYEASARLISAVDQMLQTVVNMKQ